MFLVWLLVAPILQLEFLLLKKMCPGTENSSTALMCRLCVILLRTF